MSLDFGSKQKNEQQFREELRILATQIETINQQLATGVGGGTSGPATAKAFNDMNTKLAYLYDYLKTVQADLHADNKATTDQVSTRINAVLQKNLSDIYAQLQELQKLHLAGASGGNDTAAIEDVRTTIKDLVKVYREEVDTFKAQNAFLQQKLVDIEKRLGNLEK